MHWALPAGVQIPSGVVSGLSAQRRHRWCPIPATNHYFCLWLVISRIFRAGRGGGHAMCAAMLAKLVVRFPRVFSMRVKVAPAARAWADRGYRHGGLMIDRGGHGSSGLFLTHGARRPHKAQFRKGSGREPRSCHRQACSRIAESRNANPGTP